MKATMLILSKISLSRAAREALVSAASALGHPQPPHFASLSDVEDLRLLVHEADPWHVIALDTPSVEALKTAFPKEAEGLGEDAPVDAHGYLLVAVPGFEECLDDLQKKRIAWNRLKAAQYPTSPL